MSEVSAEAQQSEQIDETKIIQYLQDNPEVLMKYPDIFSALAIPHQTGAATSLVERQLKLLREENLSLKSKIDELVGIARENEELNQRFHRLALELMNTDQLHDVLAMVQDQVQTFFYTDFVCFRFLPGISVDSVCGRQDEKINRELFGPELHIGSSAMIPLYHTKGLGLLCLGSTSADRFGLSMGTIFLQQLGELVSNRLKNLLQVA
jgi:uncharacterized protein YigA (DUF484 family)